MNKIDTMSVNAIRVLSADAIPESKIRTSGTSTGSRSNGL